MRWSISAHYLFRKCQRAFFFAYVMASHGRKNQLRREAYILKQLKSMYEWRGNLVHQAISNFYIPELENGSEIYIEQLNEKILQLAKDQYEFSKEQQYRTTQRSKNDIGLGYSALLCHEIGDYSQLKYKDVCDHITKSINNLVDNSEIQEILKDGYRYYPEQHLPFSVDNTSVAAIADLIIKKPDRKITLIDWKAGKSKTSDYSLQLLVYTLGLLHRWKNVSIDDIEAYEINLLTNKIMRHNISEGKTNNIEDFILLSANQINELTEGKKYNISMMNDFNYARTEKTCKMCKFRNLCMRLADEKASSQLV